MPNAAELNDVSKVYRRRHLGRLTLTPGVDAVSFALRQGEVFGLLGLNGAGKTTTIKLLLGLLFPTRGQVRLFDQPIPDLAVMNKVGYLPELPSFYKYLTVTELLQLYATLSDLPRALLDDRTPKVIAQVGLAPHVKKRLGEYSKGMLQRAGLAQALLHDPELLVLDEPVSGLDPLGLKEIRQLLSDLNKQGKTIFFSSHIISEAEKLCHRAAIIHEGRLARIVERSEWSGAGAPSVAGDPVPPPLRTGSGAEGRLEQIFLETIHA